MHSTGDNFSIHRSIHDRLILVGHRGYLGAHILENLVKKQIAYRTLDPRTEDLSLNLLKESDVVIDASRIRRFDSEALVADEIAHEKLGSAISKVGARYVRIASTLEKTPKVPPTQYLAWSSGRTHKIQKEWGNIDSQVIYVPNIFGGENSSSVVDLLKKNHRKGMQLELSDPNAFRDFLHVDFFLEAIMQSLENIAHSNCESITLTSGFEYRIGDLGKCLLRNSSEGVTRRLIPYANTDQCFHYPDTVLTYLLTA